jgi:hypothetical protein
LKIAFSLALPVLELDTQHTQRTLRCNGRTRVVCEFTSRIQ